VGCGFGTWDVSDFHHGSGIQPFFWQIHLNPALAKFLVVLADLQNCSGHGLFTPKSIEASVDL